MKSDVESSTEEYAKRFAGPVGEWFLEKQLSITESMLGPKEETILDVGGGHAQLANPLHERGYNITVIGSDIICRERLNKDINFVAHNLYELPFPDKSFDTVICFRLVSHSPDWQRLVSELCRVSRKRVIIDYPNWVSLNVFTPFLFRLKRKLEGTTRPYRMFLRKEISKAFEAKNFAAERSIGQYFLPMIFYKILKSRSIGEKLEGIFHRMGLQAYSSPVIAAWANELDKISNRF